MEGVGKEKRRKGYLSIISAVCANITGFYKAPTKSFIA